MSFSESQNPQAFELQEDHNLLAMSEPTMRLWLASTYSYGQVMKCRGSLETGFVAP